MGSEVRVFNHIYANFTKCVNYFVRNYYEVQTILCLKMKFDSSCNKMWKIKSREKRIRRS